MTQELSVEQKYELFKDHLFDPYASIKSLNLGARIENPLLFETMMYLGDLALATEDDLLRVPNLGKKGIKKIKSRAAKINIYPGGHYPGLREIMEHKTLEDRVKQRQMGFDF